MNYENMPFGKYKGTPINEIPSNYLIYAIEQFDLPDELDLSIRMEIIDRIDYREFLVSHRVKSTYLLLAKKYHPDKGGSTKEMQVVQEFYNLITQE